MALRSHLVANASLGPYGDGEYTYAENLWSSVPDDTLSGAHCAPTSDPLY